MELLYLRVNDALRRYYESLGAKYDNQLSVYCDENGYDDDDETFTSEMQESVEDCLVLESFNNFNFPFPPEEEPKHENGKKQFIYDLIKKCMQNPDIGFSKAMPNFGPNLFDINGDDLDKIRQKFRDQCKALWCTEFAADGGLLTMLAVGRKDDFNYLQHLVDDYNRWRVKNQNEPGLKLSLVEWSDNHQHFNEMRAKKISVGVSTGNVKSIKKHEALVCGAVSSFGRRICSPLELKPMQRIDDSLETIVKYINNAVDFVWNKAKMSQKEELTICPFQMDFCFVVGKSVEDENTENIRDNDVADDGDDDDNENEEKLKKLKLVGDIKEKLQNAGSKYAMCQRGSAKDDEEQKDTRVFRDLYDSFLTKHNFRKQDKKSPYLYHKRLIAMIDRRKSKDDQKKEDDIWMYEPSKDYKEITNSTVSEWYFNSSIGCLLPNKNKKEEILIGAKDHCNGGLMTLSFHVKEIRKIKCYLYWSGTMIRFMPDDIKDVLPQLFNPDRSHVDNTHGALDEMIADMKTKLVDEEFSAFQATYNN